jgi:cellulose synthase/poly-beta-1,6-N-acetylglucosamine synthase-like glycosyltransferase
VTLVFLAVLALVAIHLTYLVWLSLAPDAPMATPHTNAEPGLPRIDIFVPTLNEEAFIAQKLENLQRLAYPRQLLSITVLDGGSDDRTLDLLTAAATASPAAAATAGADGADGAADTARINIVRTSRRGKAAQLGAGLPHATADFILVTDADARLEPDALGRLVAAMQADDTVGVAGVPVTPFANDAHPAEQLHWRLLNWMHRQEARRGSASIVTGPCYLLRRGIVSRIPEGVVADDVFVSCAAASAGYRVAWVDTPVTELRAPRTAREMFQYRRRRGGAYLREVMRFLPRAPRMTPPARAIFLWRAALVLTIPFGGAALAVVCLLAAASFTTLATSAKGPKEEAVR